MILSQFQWLAIFFIICLLRCTCKWLWVKFCIYCIPHIFAKMIIFFSHCHINFFYSFSYSHPFGQFYGSRALGGTIAGRRKSQYFWFSAEPHKFVNIQTMLAHYPGPAATALNPWGWSKGSKLWEQECSFPIVFSHQCNVPQTRFFFFISFKLVSKGYNIKAWTEGFCTAIRKTEFQSQLFDTWNLILLQSKNMHRGGNKKFTQITLNLGIICIIMKAYIFPVHQYSVCTFLEAILCHEASL